MLSDLGGEFFQRFNADGKGRFENRDTRFGSADAPLLPIRD